MINWLFIGEDFNEATWRSHPLNYGLHDDDEEEDNDHRNDTKSDKKEDDTDADKEELINISDILLANM